MPQPLIETAAEARRLARTIAHDILLYHGDKIDVAIAKDNVFSALANELEQSIALYSRRVVSNLDPEGHFVACAFVDVIVASRGHIPSRMW